MMRLVLLLLVGFLMNACTSDQQKSAEKFIKETIEINWYDGIPLDDLCDANKICQKHSDYKGCNVIYEQVTDVAVSLKSCSVDKRSRLCQAVVLVISKHPISKVLSALEAVDLPKNPFYWSLPTKALEAQSSNFNYRSETMNWWWANWKVVIWSTTIILFFAFGSFRYWIYHKKIQLEIALDNKAKIALQMEEEKRFAKQVQQDKRLQALRFEAEKEADLAKQKIIEEENKVALEVKVANEKLATLAAEKAEAEALLNAVFKPKD